MTKTQQKLKQEFERQVNMLRGVGQIPTLQIIVQEFQEKKPAPNKPKAQWPPKNIERRKA